MQTDDAKTEAHADVEFRLEIARATRNPHVRNLLEGVMDSISFDLLLKHRQSVGACSNYLHEINGSKPPSYHK